MTGVSYISIAAAARIGELVYRVRTESQINLFSHQIIDNNLIYLSWVSPAPAPPTSYSSMKAILRTLRYSVGVKLDLDTNRYLVLVGRDRSE